MKKNLIILAAIAFLAIGVFSCQSGGGDPKTVLLNFFERISKKDFDGAAKLATKSSQSTIDMIKKGMEMAEKMKLDSLAAKEDPSEEFKNIEFVSERIAGDTAYVTIRNKAKEEESTEIALVKEDGAWKVDFSMASLMKMGAEKAKNTPGDDAFDGSLPDSLPELSADQLEKAKQMTDSLMKNIDPEQLKKLEELQKSLEQQNK